MSRYLVCFGLLFVFGVGKLQWEQSLTHDLHRAHFLEYQVNLDVRRQAGQLGFIAALSGYRAVLADYLWIDAYLAWTRTEWGRMKLLFDVVTTLQPRAMLFWDGAAWHMAWNASVAALDNPKQPREMLRQKAAHEYILLGEQYLLEGIRHNPDHAMLYERLGDLYQRKLDDHCRAAQAYLEAAKRPDAMPYVKREAAYELTRCPGHTREAYEMLVQLYRQSKDERLPTALKLIDRLQQELQIPEAERIRVQEDLKEATPQR